MLTGSSQLIWITGAGSGIGRATALELARLGHSVVVSGRRLEPLQDLVKDARHFPGQLLPLTLDVTEPQSVHDAFSTLCARWGVPDAAILCAGNHQPMPVDQFSLERCQALIDVNYLGMMRLVERLLPAFRSRGCGTMVLVASVAGYRGLPTAAAYGGSKAAVINAAEALRCELEGSDIHIKLVNPGFVRTPLTDRNEFKMPFLIEPEEAARSIVKGMQRPGFEIAFPWRFALIMKMLRLLPYGLYFRLIKRKTGL
ncbi:MAG: oxidoreductase [Oceanospirillaceae bacterium]|nr:oxidoreductase [Oceanospirillaceae bacterium]